MALEYESHHHTHMTDKFTWQGASHPLNALPVMHANDGRTFSPSDFAEYTLRHRKEAQPEKGHGECAGYVVQALKACGLEVPNCPYSACQYVFHLPEWGFRMVTSGICDRTPDGYEPCIGDICVLAAGPESIHGHICVYTAEGWCSDWIYESGMNPYSGECQYKIYRWGK